MVVGLAGTAAGFISFFAPRMQGSQQLAVAAGALSMLVVVVSVGASVTASSDTVQVNDVQLLAEGIEYPEVLDASAGLIGFHVANRDRVRHTFVIEGTNVRLGVPASKERRVEVELAAGAYQFRCDVSGHERMEGVLTREPEVNAFSPWVKPRASRALPAARWRRSSLTGGVP